MDITEKLRLVLDKQKEQAKEFERTVAELEQIDFVGQNELLKKELEASQRQVSQLEKRCEALQGEVSGLNAAMFRHAYSERETALRVTRDKLDIYFASNEKEALNRLSVFEQQCGERIGNLRAQINEDIDRYFPDLLRNCDAMEKSLNDTVARMRDNIQQGYANERNTANDAFSDMGKQPLTPEQVAAAAKKDNLERAVGSRIINIAGLILIIFGVVFGTQYVYTNILSSNELKGALVYLLGAAFLVTGEILSKRWRGFFATSLTALGVGILFSATALAYFSLNVFGMIPAVLMCVAVTAVSFTLSLRYNSRVIAAMSLVGGYLPLLAVNGSDTILIYMLGYFLMLNLFALLVSAKKSWLVLRFLSFGFNTVSISYLVLANWWYSAVQPFLLAYVIAAFVMYLCMAIIHPVARRVKMPHSAIVLMALDTVVYCPLMYFLLENISLDYLNGLFAVVICAIYFLFAKLVEKYVPTGTHNAAIFYLTALTFAVLAVPLQLGMYWTLLGWLVMGTSLASYGIIKKESIYERAGYILFGLCLVEFAYVDLLSAQYLYGDWGELIWRYSAVTAGAIIILSAMLFSRRNDIVYWGSKKSAFARVGKYAVIINTWLYLVCLSQYLLNVVWVSLPDSIWSSFSVLAVSGITLGYATVFRRLRFLRDDVTDIIFIALQGIGFLAALAANAVSYRDGIFAGQSGVVATIVLVVFDALILVAVWSFARDFYLRKKLDFMWIPLAVSVSGLILLTQILIVQFNLEITSMVISIIYIAAAFGFVFYGFRRKNAMLRRFGLAVAILAIVKLFVVDLAFLRSIERIISYFVFGVVLIAISYVYQLFSKQLEVRLKAEAFPPTDGEHGQEQPGKDDGDEPKA